MSIKIHHGGNGAYKTSGAIQDDAVPALKSGRVVVTNIRGFTLERVYSVYPDLPDTAQIINLSLESLDDLERMRTWFLWVPQGAFIIFDETQLIFLKSWREADLRRFDYPGGAEQAAADNRPTGWLDAWTRHRHFGWDVVLTTPNVNYIRDDIRMTCEMAYRHTNLAVIGIPRWYKEGQHDAQLNRPPAEGTIVQYKRIRKETFKLYLSTATGATNDTKAGKSLFGSPKLLFLLALLAGVVLYIATGDGLRYFNPDAHKASTPVVAGAVPAAQASAAVVSASGAGSGGHVLSGHVLARQPDQAVALDHPFFAFAITIGAYVQGESGRELYSLFLKSPEGEVIQVTSGQLVASGYRFLRHGHCIASLYYGAYRRVITC
ncbi:zonular occludens toxin domain-containing protein [Stutzerimonas kirkiae]|uniref:zonular occludens toxin domain-containing protein n=1 Tax=Stutzerimonas kirkiae TaxID=2211392 RepID=UPI0010385A5B|nr:zonular occludens toxin domain-containing protein [Stutzerimonas kirkiae]TBV13213.1 hypothetical protein DNK01_12200 [Stutzerimonas kirkiae]